MGLYVNPPDGALVLCVDEKSQIQALDRTAPVLSSAPWTARTAHSRLRPPRNHQPLRGTRCGLGHGDLGHDRAAPGLGVPSFLNLINRSVPEDLDIHLVVDNVSTHKTPEIKKWLLRHPRFQLHFTPTYSSWMNRVERWFAELTNKWLGAARTARPKSSTQPSGVDRSLERRTHPLRLAQKRRRDSRHAGYLLPADF